MNEQEPHNRPPMIRWQRQVNDMPFIGQAFPADSCKFIESRVVREDKGASYVEIHYTFEVDSDLLNPPRAD